MEALEKLVFLSLCLLLMLLFLSWMVTKLVEVNDYREQAEDKDDESENKYARNDLGVKFEKSKFTFDLLGNSKICVSILNWFLKLFVRFLDILNFLTLSKKEMIIC